MFHLANSEITTTDNKITFFAVDNGDSVLLEAHAKTIMTDLKYRNPDPNNGNSDLDDIAPIIRDACHNDRLDVFVLTHPDKDHLLGYDKIFHVGAPKYRNRTPTYGNVKIIVDEIWCSPYALKPNYVTDEAKPVFDEISRRYKLRNTVESLTNGNRLKVLTAGKGQQESLLGGLKWRLLAPTESEAKIPRVAKNEPENSSNPSSLVIQWSVTVDNSTSKVLLGGDSTVEVWERINSDYLPVEKEWNILLAPHHCSRHSIGRDDGSDTFKFSDEAISALNNPTGNSPCIICSSRKFKTGQTPPNPLAYKKYLEFLSQHGQTSSDSQSRFFITAGKDKKKPAHIVFKFTAKGLMNVSAGTATYRPTSASNVLGSRGYG